MSKVSAYPNEFFNSVEEYVDFAVANKVFGADAIKLRKEQLKPRIPLPRIKPMKRIILVSCSNCSLGIDCPDYGNHEIPEIK